MSDIKQILVHVPSHRTLGAHVLYAARLARTLDARLTGLHAVELPYSIEELRHVDFVSGSLIAQLEKLWVDAELAETRFVAAAGQEGAPSADWLVGQGDPVALLTFAAASRELLEIGSSPGSLHASPMLVARAILSCGAPCLVVPDAARGAVPTYDTIAIAWNGSLESVRALHGALPLLALARGVVILRGRERDYSRMKSMPLFDLDRFLDSHRITVAREYVDSGSDDGELLPDRALAHGASLLVMGAYGHSRFSEWALGGATRHALHHSAVPLLMRH